MASGKARGIKRSSATSSYSSATTIVIFVGLSVLGLCLLTSNSFSTTTTTGTTATPKRPKSISHSHHSKPSVSKVLPVHEEDVPTEIPDDPIKSVDRVRSDDVTEIQETHDDDASTGETGSIEKGNEERVDQNEEQETKVVPDQSADEGVKTEAKISDDDGGLADHEDIKELREKESLEEQEKQTALETQTSEESSITQKQHVEQTTNVEIKDLESGQNGGVEEKKDEDVPQADTSEKKDEDVSQADASETAQNLITDEDQQRRIDEHQQREDDQNQQEGQSKDPHGATSKDQIQHDEAPCLDNEKVISKLHSRKHHEHRERHCPGEAPTCLVPLPQGYKPRIDSN